SNPSRFLNCDDCPVENVSWDDAQDFLKKLNARYPGKNYRLPTEAEWEYAARGGGQAVLFGNGKNMANPAEVNFEASDDFKTTYSQVGTPREKTIPVGSLNSPNALGLHDMSGNVWEWCSDWYDFYASEPQTNPNGAGIGSVRVIRGGAWHNAPWYSRVATRDYNAPDNRREDTGFRLARSR
ncbi:MAG: formylglycine-generating enzyme family protein, partial [Saprospiraceae bacterium]|nr:formylglycine-generating enzyme family protein [Saprospiraceae bacterium]